MAYFELENDGTDNLIAGDDVTSFHIDTDSHVDILIWNNTDTTVDVELWTTHRECIWVPSATEHQIVHDRHNHRDITVGPHTSTGNWIRVTKIQPQFYIPVRITNTSDSNTHQWLDPNGCKVYESGHGGSVFNGQRVWVLNYNEQSALS